MNDFIAALVDIENDPEFIAKAMEAEEDVCGGNHSASHRPRGNAWQRKREHKKKLVRQFLSINPAMDYSGFGGMNVGQAIYVHCPLLENGEFFDHRMDYTINPYTKVFLSTRGDLRKYRGIISMSRSGSFSLTNKDRDIAKRTNKRIRKLQLEEGIASFAYLKKAYGPLIDYGW